MVTDEQLAHYIEYADIVGDNGTPGISTGELAAMARELQSLRASIPGGVGVEEIAKMVDPLAWSETYPNGYKTARKVALERAARILSALDLSSAAGEPVAYLRDLQPDAEDEALAVCWSSDPGAFPVYAAPPNPVISDEMVERVLAWVREDVLPAYGITHATRASDPEMIEGLTATLSEKPQSDGDHHEQ